MRDIVEFFKDVTLQQTTFENQSQLLRSIAPQASNVECNLSSLMKAHCMGEGITNVLEANDLVSVAQKVGQHRTGIGSDKITQAVEAGSERAPIEASIIECLQNSIDAIKNICVNSDNQPFKDALDYRKKHIRSPKDIVENLTSVECSLGFIPAQTDSQASHLVLSISDHVGMMSLKTLLTDLVVPDYSSKSPAQGSVGVMGNGTFKLYQATTKVYFITRLISNPDKVFCLIITPLRNEHNVVYDLHIQCCDISSDLQMSNFFGTSIIAVFKPEEHNKNTFNFLAAQL